MYKILSALAAGVLFAVGLVVSGMTQPDVVRGFLNVGGIVNPTLFGAWNASLAFVMGGAVLVTLPAFAWLRRRGGQPWFARKFELPTRTDIDVRLLIGAVLFGVGWGIAGYCPGPALASVLFGGASVGVFVVAMLLGMWLTKRILR